MQSTKGCINTSKECHFSMTRQSSEGVNHGNHLVWSCRGGSARLSLKLEVGVHGDVKVGDIVFALARRQSRGEQGPMTSQPNETEKNATKETGAVINSTTMRIINML